MSLTLDNSNLVLAWHTPDMLIRSQSPFWSPIVWRNPHYLDRDHKHDHRSRSRSPPDRGRLADRRSHGVLQTNLIATTYLITDHDLDHLPDRDHFADR